jgi:CubicO group peptidase (beta-lactamase class C family)
MSGDAGGSRAIGLMTMKRAAVVVVVLLLSGCRGRAPGLGEPIAAVPPALDAPDFGAVEDAVNADLGANLATGAQVAVWLNDQIYVVGNFGTRDPVEGTPVTDATQFNIGSDTKKLTATAALRRVDAGAFTMDTTVGDVLPDLALSHAPALTSARLHELISHQGDGLDWVDQDTQTTDEELRATAYGAYAGDVYSLAPPGAFYNYSNPNFSLTGLMIETASDTPFADVLEREIFAPLGMTSTVARKSEVGAEGAGGTGFVPNGALVPAGHSFADAWETGFIRPAGGVWSTASD